MSNLDYFKLTDEEREHLWNTPGGWSQAIADKCDALFQKLVPGDDSVTLTLTKAEAKAYVVMLERAFDEFGNHGCNDFDLEYEANLSKEEQATFYDVYDQIMAPRNGNELAVRNGSESDFMVLAMIKQRIEDVLKESEDE